ncbi:MAG: hypothetical protein LIO93_05525 [Bacteroidales bacterium]|nr:hypothetical protein [Bacteroidales bacterium]
MEQAVYIIGFVVLLVVANHFMKKVKTDSEYEEAKMLEEEQIKKEVQEEEVVDKE